ncbi:FISUMP domain-containing protein [Flavobacteriaceae bacterium S356]|uniref:FISUMP domain-containing protein n=1 Tax=Asprobacillus argus TaxID=3076534 RepID=A0ABU3LB57_9FLAO|nr:FISUMP domain-containing protein [Flavobacteriaceae bacterium S356]
MRKKIIQSIALFGMVSNVMCQVGVGTSNPDNSAVLEVNSTAKGFLLPRITKAQILAISNPAEGLIVYCTDCALKGMYIFDGELFNNFAGTSSIVNTVTGAGGNEWMDRNLGASRVAIFRSDHLAYGNIYQWGRNSDGHEVITWVSAATTDGTEQANQTSGPVASGAEGTNFITVSGQIDWLTVQDDTRWNGINKGTHDPCPLGFRIPTEAEWTAERVTWASSNRDGAFASSLKLPTPGIRINSGELFAIGGDGFYWSSTVDGTVSNALNFNSSQAENVTLNRSYGMSVRCIKE